ncbi:MAG: hypothetical protein OXL97_02270 [Chloroflexota bacterium]|nr:hypothetical protein [Chloroflexota bacterium]MDE2883709.1 hypothetical protein [Chloroflexota bacterium]
MAALTHGRLEEAAARARARAEVLREYLEYVYRVRPGEMGMLTCNEGETTRDVRRNLTLAAMVAGEPIGIALRRRPRAVCFWLERRGRGRPRRAG